MPRQWGWWIAGLALTGLILSNQGLRDYWHKRKRFHKLQKKLVEIRTQNMNLTSEIQRLKTDPKIIGEYARKELGMIQPGEIEYRFVVEDPAPKK